MLRCSRCGRKRPGYDRGGGVRRWRHQDFGCWRVELVADMPRVECPKCGVVIAQVPGRAREPVHPVFWQVGVRRGKPSAHTAEKQRLLLFSWVRGWISVVGCRGRRIEA
ncbi:transposase family protein [Bifidobacterium callitrichos]|uniref:transposase family protein n=1 Tax=Bifidobacterium callitrichos TaxID=762209 RepID=UPI0021590870|nr:transposase family protein [Bifidobacterium callitrichos]